ncbi:hypothetical protein J2W91_002150 [Paenibacillus amylolyticus]|uniref:Uncharacterized protein n=1 Tax=Paenibacillus amylolyticus TaxID=1451 RepID=A0AAP5H2S8_PAEAM|nr:hypothetical protein [Paenibacillus amylolyticus]
MHFRSFETRPMLPAFFGFERLNFRLMERVLVLLRKEKLKCNRMVTIIITVKRNTYSYIY